MTIVHFKRNHPKDAATYCFEDAVGKIYLLRFGLNSEPVKGLSPGFFDRCVEAKTIKIRYRNEDGVSVISEIIGMK